MTHGQAPDQSQVRPEWKDKVLHARMTLGGTDLMGADIPAYQPMRSVYMSLGVDTDAEAERIFSALSRAARSSCRCRRRFLPPGSDSAGTSSALRG